MNRLPEYKTPGMPAYYRRGILINPNAPDGIKLLGERGYGYSKKYKIHFPYMVPGDGEWIPLRRIDPVDYPLRPDLHYLYENAERFYGRGEQKTQVGDLCPICLEPMSHYGTHTLNCEGKHTFHKNCIAATFDNTNKHNCPVCRQPARQRKRSKTRNKSKRFRK